MKTKFAPPERMPKEYIQKIAEQLRAEILLPWFDAVPVSVLVINEYRQIVFCNQVFKNVSDRLDMDELIGLRPGEALRCVHAQLEEGGCGCSGFCRLCGAAQAILSSLRGDDDCQECRILRQAETGVAPLDLQVFTKTIEFLGSPFVLFTALDVSHEKRLRYMERTFYHDLINVSGGMSALTGLMDVEGGAGGENMALLAECSRRLALQAVYHRDVTAAEAGQLVVGMERLESKAFFDEVVGNFRALYPDFKTPLTLRIECGAVRTDRRLFGHVLRNLLINAKEACAFTGGETVLSCREVGDALHVSVENPGVMGEDMKGQLFKRYISTKGADRGLGCYVARLLTEKYLKGTLDFSSDDGRTVFTVSLPK